MDHVDDREPTKETAIRLKGITKTFPGVRANDDIHLEVRPGEIHALVGENGAGKSTLMNILSGLYQPDSGTIELWDREVDFASPRDAMLAGIGMVHQHFMLVQRHSILENVVLGAEDGARIRRGRATDKLLDLCEQYGFDLDPEEPVRDLSVGQQQQVEILKVLYRGADIIILDEPTAVLVPQEVEELFTYLQRMAKQGKTVVFISHKLDEVLTIADRISILRQGKMVGTVDAARTSKKDLARRMVGRPVLFDIEKDEHPPGEPLLRVDNAVIAPPGRRPLLSGATFEMRRGEIYGIAGVEGNGQGPLLESLVGLRKLTEGRITIDGRDISDDSALDLRRRGVAYIPEDRQRHGLVLPMTVWENLILGHHGTQRNAPGGVLDTEAIKERSTELIEAYDIRTTSKVAPVYTMSGGNQQKVILARELSTDPDLIIASQPTRGLDVGAIEFVREQLLKARKDDKGILLISADLDEIVALSDRIGVIYNGRIVAEFDEGVSAEILGRYMLGSELGDADTVDSAAGRGDRE